MPKATKRAKPAQKQEGQDTPFTFKVTARKPPRGGPPASLTVTLSVPRDDDECPLTLDAIKDSKLDFLPDAAFRQGKPLHSMVTLPCRHSFHALSLVYSWCKNGMRCPCCRAGLQERADPGCLPEHLRAAIAERVRETLESERETDTAGQLMHIYGVTVPYSTLAQAGCLIMMISFLERDDSEEPLFSFSARLDEMGGTEERPIFVPRCHLSSISNIQQVQVGAVQLKVQLDVPEVGTIAIDASRPVAIAAGTISVPGAHGQFMQEIGMQFSERTRFEISAAEGRNGMALYGLRWCPEGQFMELLATSE